MSERSSFSSDENSSGWNSSASSSSSTSYSSSSSQLFEQPIMAASAFRRRGHNGPEGEGRVRNSVDGKQPSRGVRTSWSSILRRSKSKKRIQKFCGQASTLLLLCCLFLWLVVYFRNQRSAVYSNPALPIRERTKLRTEHNSQRGWFFSSFFGKDFSPPELPLRKGKKKNSENLPPGCERPEWQTKSYPACNEMHEIDLANTMRSRVVSAPVYTGYIASGLWRSVWAVDPRAVMAEPVAMKMMKNEHDVNDRNFDRHRRDALVMERLTSSPYVVDAYAFCGNSVLTEYIDVPLDKLIYDNKWPNSTFISAETKIGWAVDAAKGVQALHEVDGGPIVHTDLQARQFLLSKNGKVLINDFNRCRFMAAKDGVPCKLRIPSAPGKSRSPEEYEQELLDEELDVYSLANVLFGIFARKKPWENFSIKKFKKLVQDGHKPEMRIDFDLSKPDQNTLRSLVHRAYERNPKDRITAAELVSGLEEVLDRIKQ